MEEEENGRSFPGCMKGLVHFLDLHHYLHIKKMKMLAYRKHGEGKRAARNKEPKIDPYAPSTSQQFTCAEDTYFGVEDKISTRKQPVKASMSKSIPKWRLREHNKKGKVFLPASRLLRTSSIHHWSDWSEDRADNVNFGVETSAIEQNVDVNKASSSNDRVVLPSSKLPISFDKHNFEKLGDENMAYGKSGSFGQIQPDELKSILLTKQLHPSNNLNETEVGSLAQKYSNVKELQGDNILHPSKEFLAMMKLFNGNIELIQNILDDPSFIFAHYLQAKQASDAELTRAYSFPASWQPGRKIDGQFRIKNKRFESESLVKQSDKFHSEKTPAHTDIVEDDTPKAEMMDCDERNTSKLLETYTNLNDPSEMRAPSSILQNVRNNLPNSNLFTTIELNKKEHHRIFMDGIFHKIPFGRKVMGAMKKSKSGWWDGSSIERHDGEGPIHASWNKINKHTKKNIQRFHSLNDSSERYSHLYESISKEEFSRLHEITKVKSLGRLLSLPDIKYCLSSINAQSEAPTFSSPNKLNTPFIDKILKKDDSVDFTPENKSKETLIDCGKILLRSNEKEYGESCQLSKNVSVDDLIVEENGSITQRGEKLLDEAHTHVPTKPTLVSSNGVEHKYPSSVAGLETNEIDLSIEKPFPDIDSLHLQINQKDEAKFNYVREILRRSGFSGSDFLGAWHSPYQPMDPLIVYEAEGLSYELENTEDENGLLFEHKFLFDLINEVLVEIYKNFLGYFSPWLSCFDTNTRPMPMGNQILEEIWANICWHMKCQPQLGITSEDIVSRNFTKNDGWMNMQYDIEDVELDLECLILDALLDDVVLELSFLLGSNPFSC